MKTLKNLSSSNLRNATLFIALLLGIIVLLQSCMKKNNVIEPGLATLTVVNTGTPSLDIYFENSKQNQLPLLYSQSTGYGELISGTRGVTIIKGGSVNNADILIAGNILFEEGKNYSIFINRKSATSTDSITGLIIEDDLALPANGKAKIRFANHTPNAPAVDLIAKGGSILFTNKAFGTVSDFITIDPAISYILEIHQTGSNTVKLEIPAFNVEANKIYTVYINGLWAGTAGNDVFDAHVIINK